MNSKSLKKLALSSAISICAGNSILYSMDNINQDISDEASIIQTMQSIDLKQEIKNFNTLSENADYKYLNELKSQIHDIKEYYSEEMVKLITETAHYYKKTETISYAFWQIWINCLDNNNRLTKIKKQYKNNENVMKVIENKLKENSELNYAAFKKWVVERHMLREILVDLRNKINNMHKKQHSIDDKLIQEMNTAIKTMRKNKD